MGACTPGPRTPFLFQAATMGLSAVKAAKVSSKRSVRKKPDLQLPEQLRLRHQQAPPEPLPVLPAEEVLGDGHEDGV